MILTNSRVAPAISAASSTALITAAPPSRPNTREVPLINTPIQRLASPPPARSPHLPGHHPGRGLGAVARPRGPQVIAPFITARSACSTVRTERPSSRPPAAAPRHSDRRSSWTTCSPFASAPGPPPVIVDNKEDAPPPLAPQALPDLFRHHQNARYPATLPASDHGRPPAWTVRERRRLRPLRKAVSIIT
jgi:hypothetical protein